MALEVRRKRRVNPGRFISTAVVMLALMAQPMYGLVAGKVANAATSVNAVTEVSGTDNSITLKSSVNESDADTDAPHVQFVNAPQFVNSGNHKFNLKATDADSGVGNWRMIFLNETGDYNIGIGSVPCSPQTQGNSATATCYANANLDKFESGKTYTARAYAKDTKGNEGYADHKFTVDESLPEVQFAKTPQFINPTTYKFELAATDTISGVAHWRTVFLDENGNDIRIDSVPCTPQTYGSSATATCFAGNDFSKFISGKTYTARAIATDKAGNIGTVDHEFTADTAGPTITVFEFQNAIDGKFNPAKVIARATDDESFVTSVGIDTYKLQDDGTWKYIYSPFVQGDPMGSERDYAEFSSDNPRISQDGTYMLVAWAVDKAGNVGEKKKSDPFTVDKTAPVIENIVATVTTNSITVSGTTDSNDDVTVRLANGATQAVTPVNGAWSVTFAGLIPGETYSYTVTSADAIGNEFSTGLNAFSATTNDVVAMITRDAQTQIASPLVSFPGETPAVNTFANVFTLPGETANDDQDDNAAVLGAQTDRSVGSSNQFAAAVPTADGWKIFGLMWYWWLLIVAAVAGLIWFIAAARRRNSDA